jgi:N-acetyl-anhydromuramoyl-L-alanine amidase
MAVEAATAAPFAVDAPTGLLTGVRQVISPHRDARPQGLAPQLIVVHGISLPPGKFGGPWIERLFAGGALGATDPFFETIAGLRVSAHALVRRDGCITQFVPFHERAWHAGASSWNGREACNDYSIGVELEGTDDLPYEDAQYASLVALVRALVTIYPGLSRERIVGHSDIAPGRKSDPGKSFDWARLRRALA